MVAFSVIPAGERTLVINLSSTCHCLSLCFHCLPAANTVDERTVIGFLVCVCSTAIQRLMRWQCGGTCWQQAYVLRTCGSGWLPIRTIPGAPHSDDDNDDDDDSCIAFRFLRRPQPAATGCNRLRNQSRARILTAQPCGVGRSQPGTEGADAGRDRAGLSRLPVRRPVLLLRCSRQAAAALAEQARDSGRRRRGAERPARAAGIGGAGHGAGGCRAVGGGGGGGGREQRCASVSGRHGIAGRAVLNKRAQDLPSRCRCT